MKESSGQQFSPPVKGSETGVKSRYLRENGLKHIEVHSLVSGDVLDLDVRTFRQCLTVKYMVYVSVSSSKMIFSLLAEVLFLARLI